MTKVIECLLFFQEIDLLEIRLEYLFSEIDYFIIIEASQTFSGKKKEFILEKNFKKFSRFKKKIIYFKLDEFHNSIKSIYNFNKNINNPIRKKIINLIKQHKYYDKSHLPWILDTYHREMLHFPLSKIANDNDIVILSDLDEIPSIEFINEYKTKNYTQICSAYQKEFNYFLNYYRNNHWIGSLIFRAKNNLDISFNEIRQISKNIKSAKVKHLSTFGGYHFTSIGNINEIKNKINSWAHQEYNNKYVMRDIEENILKGQDIFGRYSGTILKKISIYDNNYFDKKLSKIISNYSNLISKIDIVKNKKNIFKFLFKFALKKINRIFFEIKIKYKKNVNK